MADGVDLSIDKAEIAREGDRIVRSYLSAGTRAIGTTTRDLEQKLERATQAAVGGKLWRAWQSSIFPRSGPARDPVGTIWLSGGDRTRGAIKFWTEPGDIHGRRGQYLAVPLPAAGPVGRSRDLTPEQWEARTGMDLRFVPRRGKAPLLVADNAVLSGRKQIVRGNTAKRIAAGRGSATVPIFVLLRVVQFGNAFAIDPMIRASEREIAANFLSETAKVG